MLSPKDEASSRREMLAKADVVYPVVLPTTIQTRFHVAVWWEVGTRWSGDRPKGFVQVSSDLVIFTSRSDRTSFRRFWRRYDPWFGRAQSTAAFLPSPPTGVLSKKPAAFIYHPIEPLDAHLPGWLGEDKTFDESMSRRGGQPWKSFMATWTWIAAYAAGPVWRVNGGWLFSNGGDLTKWRLYEDLRLKAETEMLGS